MFRLSEQRTLACTHVGAERLPLLCIDNLFAEPQELVEFARTVMFVDAGSYYPGVRAPAPEPYVAALLDAASRPIAEIFGAALSPELEMCAFSMVTTPPAKLQARQRHPHFDGPETDRIAFIHYLCGVEQGGTSLYRHRATGLAEITPMNLARYQSSLAAELAEQAPLAAYVRDGTRSFERIHTVNAVFNRLIVYKGNVLHSGDIGPGTVLSDDPRHGRLTVNGFGRLCS
jgi:hypothetical protein